MRFTTNQFLFSSATLLSSIVLSVWPCQCESLRILERHELDEHYHVSRALRAGGDSIMFTANDGLYARGSAGEEWTRLMERASSDEQVPFSVCASDRLTRLVSPEGLWQYKSDKGNDVLIFERDCNQVYRLSRTDEGTSFLTRCDKRTGHDYFGNANMQGGSMLAAMLGNDIEKRIVIQKVGSNNFRRLFRCSEEMVRWRDSVGLEHSYLGYPAIDPEDSTIWLAIDGYPFVYLVDIAGELRDSVPITNSDYHTAPRPLSRISSQAVTNEWSVRWTPVTFFFYVNPGYFIMQYRAEDAICMGEELSQVTTVVWNVNKQVVPLTIDPLWRLAGVQDDGRIIFVAREADSSDCKESIIVARIEP